MTQLTVHGYDSGADAVYASLYASRQDNPHTYRLGISLGEKSGDMTGRLGPVKAAAYQNLARADWAEGLMAGSPEHNHLSDGLDIIKAWDGENPLRVETPWMTITIARQ